MRHLFIAAVSALTLMSTAALAQQEGNRNLTREAPRAYAPATHEHDKAAQPFNIFSPQKDQNGISAEDRLFLEQGDRGLGNG